MAGIVGSLVYRWNDGEFLRPYKAALLMLLYSGFDMFLITILTPQPKGVLIANALYAPMTFGAVLGILLFTLFLTEKKEEAGKSDEQTVSDNRNIIDTNTENINEISQELNEYKDKVEKLEQKLEEYDKKFDQLEQKLKDK